MTGAAFQLDVYSDAAIEKKRDIEKARAQQVTFEL
jgi:hypothetical protein